MKFIVLEGLDGAGKSTQIKLLQKWFKELGLKFDYLHFPRTDSPVFGEMVAKFLRGDFGKLEDVNPYIVALLYAGDRNDASTFIEEKLKSDTYVLVDRYVYSNIAYQCAKFADLDEKKVLKDWILKLEYNYYKIVKPDISLFFDVPFDFTKNSLESDRTGDDRDYLQGKKDIHEVSMNFQMDVKNVYDDLLETQDDFFRINCIAENNGMLAPNDIFVQVQKLLLDNKIISK